MDKHDVLEECQQQFVMGSPKSQICWEYFEGVRKHASRKVEPLQSM